MANKRFKVLLSRVKWPGWTVIILAIITEIPDWQGRAAFWMDAAKKISGHFGVLAMIVSSPWLGIGLAVGGVLYILIAGEVEQPVRRHPGWPILGWSVVGLVLIAIWSVLVAGYVAVHVPKQADSDLSPAIASLANSNSQLRNNLNSANAQIAELQKHFGPWHLTDIEKLQLNAALSAAPIAYPVTIVSLIGNSQSQEFSRDLGDVFNKHGWKASMNIDIALRPDLVGVHIGVSPDTKTDNDIPAGAKALATVLTRANIKFDYAGMDRKKLGDFELFVVSLIGNSQSQEFSRDLGDVFNKHGWKASMNIDIALRPDLVGVHIGVSPDTKTDNDIPAGAKALATVLTRANIKFDYAGMDRKKLGDFELFVGGMPND